MKKLILKIKQRLCSHLFIADTQIKVVKCLNCDKNYRYENCSIFGKR